MSEQALRRTPFFQHVKDIGGKIVPFAGFEMPVQFRGVKEEHQTVRTKVGVFDVSHMGEIELIGNDALKNVQNIITNDASKLANGQALYTCMCFDNGGIIDDLLVYRISEQRYLLVVNASNEIKDYQWIKDHVSGNCEAINKSNEYAQLAVQGPYSLSLLKEMTKIPLEQIKYYHFIEGNLANVPMIISRTGYTGELGFELYFSTRYAEIVWNELFEKGKKYDLAPIGLGARDTLRLEMKYALYGNDIDETTSPLEAGLGWVVTLSKDTFIGKTSLLKQKENGITRKLIGFAMNDRYIPRKGYAILKNEKNIGLVTSGTQSITLGYGIGMGYVQSDVSSIGTEISIQIREGLSPAKIVKTPFIEKN